MSDSTDDTYLRDTYNFSDKSISLLVGNTQILKRMVSGMSHETIASAQEIKMFKNSNIRKSTLSAGIPVRTETAHTDGRD